MNAPAPNPAEREQPVPAPPAAPPADPAPPAHGSPVLCPSCRRPFLAPTDQPAAVIECPRCGARRQRGTLVRPPAESAAPRRAARWAGVAVLAAGATLSLLAVVAAALRQFQPVAGPPAAPSAPAPDPAQEAALREARAVAEAALGASDWRSAQPHLLDASRLAPLMERYHARHPWRPMTLVGAHSGSLATTGGTRTARLLVPSDRGSSLTLHLRETPEGWKLDWERLVNARQFEWQAFHDDRSGIPTALDVLAVRGSADDAHFAGTGLTRETGLAVRLDGPRPGLPVLAIVPRASDLGRLFQRELTWQQARPYRCRLRMADPSLVPPRVEITEFAGAGWSGE